MFRLNIKETVSVQPSRFNMYTEEERIIRLWIHARNKANYSREEFCTLLRKMLLNMFTSNVTQMKREKMIEAFSAYCQKFPTVAKHTSKILKSVIYLHEVGLWGNSFFPWSNLFSKSISIKDKEVQEYFATEPEEIVLARVHSYMMSKRVEEALIIAKNSLLYQLRVKKDGTLSSSNSLDPTRCKSLASADWFLLILQRKKSLSSIVNEVKELNCHEGLVLVNRLRKNPECKRFAYVMLQIFLVRDLIHHSSYCCTMKYFHLWCIVHKEMKSSHSEISNSARKLLSTYAPTTAHFYLFVDVLWKHFGGKLISLYVEFYIRGITADSNHLEVARNSNVAESRQLIERHLAKVFTKLSTLFSDIHEEASRECMFSAFSLRPKKQKLLILQSLTHSILDTESQHLTLTSNFISPPTLSRGFYHPLLNMGVKCVSYFLIRDLVSSLEGVRRIDFQYNVFDWRNNAAELGKFVDSSELNSVSNEDSDTEYASNESIKSTDTYSHVAETKCFVNKLEAHSTIKRKIDSNNKNQIFPLGVSANLQVSHGDNSNKRTKVQNISLNQSNKVPRSQEQIAQPYFMHDAIEDVIVRTLDNNSSTRNTNAGFSSVFFPQTSLQEKKHSVHPFSLTERGKQQDIFKNLAFPTKTNVSSVHRSIKDINYAKHYSSEQKSSVNYSTLENPVNRESVVISPKVVKSLANSRESPVQMSAEPIMKSQSNNVAYFDKFTKYTQGSNISSSNALNVHEALNLSSKDNYAHHKSNSSVANQNPKVEIEKSASSLLVSNNKHKRIAHVAHNSFLQHITQTSDLFPHQVSQRHKYSENVSTPFQCDTNLNKPVYNVHKMQAHENVQKSHFVTVKSEFDKPERYSVIQHTTQHKSSDNSHSVPNPLNFHVKTEDKSTTKFPVKIVNKSIAGRNISQLSKVFPPKTAVITQIALDTFDQGCESNNSLDLTSSVIMAPRWETSRHHHGNLKYKKNPNLIGVATTKKVYNKPHPNPKALLVRTPGSSNANILLRTLTGSPHVFENQNTVDNVKSLDTKTVTSSQAWNPAQRLEYANSVRTNISDSSNYVNVSSPTPNTAENLNKRLNPGEYMEQDLYQDRKGHLSSTNDYFCSSPFTTASVSLTNTSTQYKNMYNEVNASPHSLSNLSDSSYRHSTPPASSSITSESTSHSHSAQPSTMKTQYQYNTISCNSSTSGQSSSTTIASSRYSNIDYSGTESAPCCSPAEVQPCANCVDKSNVHASVENVASNQKYSRDMCSTSSAQTELFANSTKEQCSTLKTPVESCESISDFDFLSSSASTLNPSNNVSYTNESNLKNNGISPIGQFENSELQMEPPDKCVKKQKVSHSNYPNENEDPYCGEFNHKSSILSPSVENQTNSPNVEENVLGMCVDLLNNDYQNLTEGMNILPRNKNFNTISEQDTFFPPYSEEQSKMVSKEVHSSNFDNNYNVRKSCPSTNEKSNDLFPVNISYEDGAFHSEQHKGKEFPKTPDENVYSMSKPFVGDEQKLDFYPSILDTKVAQNILNQFDPKRLGEGSLPGVPSPIICRICKLRLRSAAAMKRHLKKSHPNILQESMMEAQFAVLTNSSAATARKASTQILKNTKSECKFCGKVLTNIYMKKHISTQHSNPQIEVENTHHLNHQIKFDNTQHLNPQMKVEHLQHLNPQIKVENSTDAVSNNEKLVFLKSKLQKSLSMPQILKKKRSSSRSTNCRICSKTFSSYGNLTRHFKTKHPEHSPPYDTDHFNKSLNDLKSNVLPASTFVGGSFTSQNTEMKKTFPQSFKPENSRTELKVDQTVATVNFSQSGKAIESSVSKQSVSSDWLFLNSGQNDIFSEAFPNNSTSDCLLDTPYNEQLSPQYESSHPQMVEIVKHEKDAKSIQDSTSEYSQAHLSKMDNEELKYLVIEDNTYITDLNSSQQAAEDSTKANNFCNEYQNLPAEDNTYITDLNSSQQAAEDSTKTNNFCNEYQNLPTEDNTYITDLNSSQQAAEDSTKANNFCNEYQNLPTEKKYIAERNSLQYNSRTPEKMKSTDESFLDTGINHSSLSIAKNETDINMPALTDLNIKYANDIDDVRFDPAFFDLHFRASSDLTEDTTAFKSYSDNNLASFNGSSSSNQDNIMKENLLETFISKTENDPNPYEKFPNENEVQKFLNDNEVQKFPNENEAGKYQNENEDKCFEGINNTDYYSNNSQLNEKENVEIFNSSDISEFCVEQQLVPPGLSDEKSNNHPTLSIPISDSFSAGNKDFTVYSFHCIEDCSKTQNMGFESYGTKKSHTQSISKSPLSNLLPESNDVSDNYYHPALSYDDAPSEELTSAELFDGSQNDCNENTNLYVQQKPIENIVVESNTEKCKICQEAFSLMSELSEHLESVHCIPVLEKQPSFEQSKILLEDTTEKLSPPHLSSPCYESESELPSLEASAVLSTNSVDKASQPGIIEQNICCDNMESESSYSLDCEMNSMKNMVSSPSDINQEGSSDIIDSKFDLTSLETCHVLPKDVEISSFDDDAQVLNLSDNAEYESSFHTDNDLLKNAKNCLGESLCKTTMQATADHKKNCENSGAESMSETCDISSKDRPEISCKKTGEQDSFHNISSMCEQESKPEACSYEIVEKLIENQHSSVPVTIDVERKLNLMTRRHSFSNSRPKPSFEDVDISAYRTLEYLDLEVRSRSKITIYEISRSNQKIDPNSRIVHPLVLRKKKCIETLHVNPHKFPPKANLQFGAASKNVPVVTNSAKCTSYTKVKQFRKKKHRICFRTEKHGPRLSKINSTFGKRNSFYKKFRRKRYGKLLISSRNNVPNLKITFNKREIIQFLKTHKQPVVKLTRLKFKDSISYSRRNSIESKQDPSYHIPPNSSKMPIVVLEKIDFGKEITNSTLLPIKAEINVLGENDALKDFFGSSEDDSLHMEHPFLSPESDVNVSNVKISVLLKNIKIGLGSNKFDENQNTELGHKCLSQNRDCKGLNCAEPPSGKKCCVLLQRLPS